jgi:hypothetical protein
MRRDEQNYWREAPGQGSGGESRELLEDMLRRPTGGSSSGFDMESAVAARPLLAFGAAVFAGFLLGTVGDDLAAPHRRGHHWLSSFDDELSILKSAALTTLGNVATQNVRQLVPGQTGEALSAIVSRSLPGASSRGGSAQSYQGGQSYTGGSFGGQSYTGGHQGGQSWTESGRSERAGSGIGIDTGGSFGGQQTSSAPNNSFDTGAGIGALGYDSPPAQAGSVSITNSEVRGVEHLDAYYPPGGAEKPIAGGATPGKGSTEDVHERLQDDPERRRGDQ